MKIIPVIDILNGVAVHAVRGHRRDYGPLESVICDSANPSAVASAFKREGFKELYIADLNAIMKNNQNFSQLEKIVDITGLEIMVDAGIFSVDHSEELLTHKVSKPVIGTETLPDLNLVKSLLNRFGSDKVIFSLDLRNGKVLSKSRMLSSMTPLGAAERLRDLGVNELILLDLARVGAGEGVNVDLIGHLIDGAKFNLYVGGGVRDMDDLRELRSLGVSGVLVATALHTGKVTIRDLKSAGMM